MAAGELEAPDRIDPMAMAGTFNEASIEALNCRRCFFVVVGAANIFAISRFRDDEQKPAEEAA